MLLPNSFPTQSHAKKLVAGSAILLPFLAHKFTFTTRDFLQGPAEFKMLENRPFGFLSMFRTMAVRVRLSTEKEEVEHTVWNRIWRFMWLALDQSVSWSARSLIKILGLAM